MQLTHATVFLLFFFFLVKHKAGKKKALDCASKAIRKEKKNYMLTLPAPF